MSRFQLSGFLPESTSERVKLYATVTLFDSLGRMPQMHGYCENAAQAHELKKVVAALNAMPPIVTCEMTIEYLSEPKPTEAKPK